MDAVILAAGRGERLRDLTPAFHKPLLPIDGVPLVCRAVDLAEEVADRVVVVVAPSNAEAISGALGRDRDVTLIVQREPRGPGDALLVGLQVCIKPRVLVLLSDNVVSLSDVVGVCDAGTGVGVKTMPRADAQRFTRFEDGRWIEREPLAPYGPPVPCWVGPFVGMREKMTNVLNRVSGHTGSDTEVLIGPYLADMMASDYARVPVDSFDVGTLATYPRGGKL